MDDALLRADQLMVEKFGSLFVFVSLFPFLLCITINS
jgi:hypothetical protein